MENKTQFSNVIKELSKQLVKIEALEEHTDWNIDETELAHVTQEINSLLKHAQTILSSERAENTRLPVMNKNAKDGLFCDYFSTPDHVLELYKALHPDDARNVK